MNYTLDHKRVVVGMSGGVDSSVAAALLMQQGFEVIGLTITPFKVDDICRYQESVKSCCSFTGLRDAAEVCNKLGIQHILVDLSQKFKNEIIEDFITEYMNGKTPNPCVKCNQLIKWSGLLQKANELGAGYVATGHYSQVIFDDEIKRCYISAGKDTAKDQSYVLWRLTQEQISRTIFPLSNFTKRETRELALSLGLNVHNKQDSQEICFIPDDDYHRFLRENVISIENKTGSGNILMHNKVIGQHKGYPFYTIGQRKGLGIAYKTPLYVNNINPQDNTIEVGTNEELLKKSLIAGSVNLIKYDSILEPMHLRVKIRYKDNGEMAYCCIKDDGKLYVDFDNYRRAITPGQSVVLYEGNDLVGGGIIESGF